ncbi:MAG: aminotransferase class I/II-fold pyridoxal phosphate-dependent enzyme [Spirochaetaceae bacterium]|nr:MAG: aminotransferase class I/II-fold pyridoxal phosphate-dependent enzyme [Spirochaetaceae bacterium]
MTPINMSSDTQTLPTEQMYDAMRSAPLGDDMLRADPTVNRLEELAAEKIGKEAALFVPSGTMGNLVSLMVHAKPGDEVIVDSESHVYYYEAGGIASVAGLMPRTVPSRGGRLDPEQVAAAVRKRDQHFPVPRVLCLENTHNRSGGRIVPVELQNRLAAVAHERGLAVHLDGARIFDAAIASGLPAAAFTEHVDSVMFCLSKGLSCPVGSIIAGTAAFIEQARLVRKRLGGAMRQAGILAACGIVALQTMIERLAEDHRRARRLAEEIATIPGLSVEMESVQTNMVYVDHTGTGLDTDELLARLATAGLLASDRAPTHFRLVANRHHGDAEIAEAVARIRRALATDDR